tara:strand:- start:1648 stop:1845 length:198 start_codon:yes stop_codon:yes gene_type:complete
MPTQKIMEKIADRWSPWSGGLVFIGDLFALFVKVIYLILLVMNDGEGGIRTHTYPIFINNIKSLR